MRQTKIAFANPWPTGHWQWQSSEVKSFWSLLLSQKESWGDQGPGKHLQDYLAFDQRISTWNEDLLIR